MTFNKFSIHIWLILILLASCSVFAQKSRNVKFGETFTLLTDEVVKTEDGKLKIQLKRVGRSISENGEVEYVELLASLNKSEQRMVISERGRSTKSIGNYRIELVNAESFGRSYCQLKIAKKVKSRD